MAQNYRLGLNNQFPPTAEDRLDLPVWKKLLLTVGNQGAGKIPGSHSNSDVTRCRQYFAFVPWAAA
jgi:hypothetical protein